VGLGEQEISESPSVIIHSNKSWECHGLDFRCNRSKLIWCYTTLMAASSNSTEIS
jgi:hypothetical protein